MLGGGAGVVLHLRGIQYVLDGIMVGTVNVCYLHRECRALVMHTGALEQDGEIYFLGL